MFERIPRRPAAALLGLALAVGALSACGGDGGTDDGEGGGRLDVQAAFYPLAWAAEQVGGEHVAVRSLTAPGAEPHDLELTPAGVADVVRADLVVYLDGFQPAVDDAVAEADDDVALDVAGAADLDLRTEGRVDPHFWLDPQRLGAVAEVVADRLADLDPDHDADYRARAAALVARLDELDGRLAAGLAQCERRDLVTSHEAFGYLARRYELDQVGITGLAPEREPSPADLARVAAYVADHDVRTIFFETLVSPAVARTIAAETGAETARLDPLEGLADDAEGEDYIEVMDANLAHLRDGLGCP